MKNENGNAALIKAGRWHISGDEIETLADPENSSSYYAPICVIDSEWAPAIRQELAALIAAAPDLLAVLDEMLADAETMREPYRNEAICERARAAIAKAKGGAQ